MRPERPDDFVTRRQSFAGLDGDKLAQRFWNLARAVVSPLVELAHGHTSPSIERSVLLRMGLSSLEARGGVDKCGEHGLLGHGAGRCLLLLAGSRGISLRAAASILAADTAWDEVAEAVKAGAKPPTVTAPVGRAGGPPADMAQGHVEQPGLAPDHQLDVEAILAGLSEYRPRRRGWTWRRALAPDSWPGPEAPFARFRQVSEPLSRSIPLPAAKYFAGIDPQPECVLTTEIASGRFEDDLRRMRMAAWHGADHLMVIRTAGQSHYDGLIEGTPEGVGGVPISRKQVRATRRALDLIEDEVGRRLNRHSCVSGVAGPEIAVMFAEEGINGAHQDPQYNVLYRNVNMIRSLVDAAVAKGLMTWAGMLQIDGAHNANATAKHALKVMPELLVQHAINCAYSVAVGMSPDLIALSTVPPTAPPAPALRMDLPYAIALRELFGQFRLRAQQNTRHIESDDREATVTHVLNLLVSRLTSVDVQSTITPDEGRNVPWHYNNVRAVDTAKQALVGMDGLADLVALRRGGELDAEVRQITERAVLFLEEIISCGGYFPAVEAGFFVDSGRYPERRGDGIVRSLAGGVGAGTVILRQPGYLAPVCAHFGRNDVPDGLAAPCELIGGCTLCRPELVQWVDELDEQDNVGERLRATEAYRGDHGLIRPEVQWAGRF